MNYKHGVVFNRKYEWFPGSMIPSDGAYKLVFWLDPHGAPHHKLAFYNKEKMQWLDTEYHEEIGHFDFWCHLPMPSDDELEKCVQYSRPKDRIITNPDGVIYKEAKRRLAETTFPGGVQNPLKR